MKYIVRGNFRNNGNFNKNSHKNFSNHILYFKTTNKDMAFNWAKKHCEKIYVTYRNSCECIIVMENGKFGLQI